jgi:ankyrin repeat protein
MSQSGSDSNSDADPATDPEAEPLKLIADAVRTNNLTQLTAITNALPDNGRALLTRFVHDIEKDVPVKELLCRGLGIMHTAAFFDSLEVFLHLSEQGFSLECLTAAQFQPIHYACIGGSIKVATFLCANAPASLTKAPGNPGVSPLFLAARSRSPEIVELLLQAGAAAAELPSSLSPVRQAVIWQDARLLNLLLQYPNLVDRVDERAYSPLMAAVVRKWTEGVKLLIDAGASVNYRTPSGRTALFCAIFVRDIEITRLLIDNGADVVQSGEFGVVFCFIWVQFTGRRSRTCWNWSNWSSARAQIRSCGTQLGNTPGRSSFRRPARSRGRF